MSDSDEDDNDYSSEEYGESGDTSDTSVEQEEEEQEAEGTEGVFEEDGDEDEAFRHGEVERNRMGDDEREQVDEQINDFLGNDDDDEEDE